MPYTQEDTVREVGDSKDWRVGLEASIKKFEQRVGGDVDSYDKHDHCGLCIVLHNKHLSCPGPDCPAQSICRSSFRGQSDKETLQALKNLRKELDPMDCSKLCANFKPKNESPFPEGLKTADLKVGMVVRKGNVHNGPICTILGQPRDIWVRALLAWPCHSPKEIIITLADYGCQPYESGTWDERNWLREVR